MPQNSQLTECETKLLTALKNVNIQILEELPPNNLISNTLNGQTITKKMDIENYCAGIRMFTTARKAIKQ